MIYQVCCIRDRATDSFGQPIFVAHVGAAERSFRDEVNSPNKENNNLAAHPEDFELYHLGSFDTDTGLFDTVRPRMLLVGKDVERKVV